MYIENQLSVFFPFIGIIHLGAGQKYSHIQFSMTHGYLAQYNRISVYYFFMAFIVLRSNLFTIGQKRYLS